MALFMYPHSITATLSAKSRNTIRKNASILPAYSFLLGLLALLGWVAIAAGTKPVGLDGKVNGQLVIPQLFEDMFPSWFAGVAFAAIAIGALVPAAIMSIAAANTFTRNIYKAWLKPDATVQQEAQVSKITSLVVKAFALVFVLTLDKSNAINFQLLGGIWILQTFPALVFYLYTRWFHRWALLAGWAVGMVYGTIAAYNVTNKATGAPFAGSVANMPVIGQLGYIAVTAFAFNVVVAAVLTLVLRAAKAPEGEDETVPADYFVDAGDPRVEKLEVGPHETDPVRLTVTEHVARQGTSTRPERVEVPTRRRLGRPCRPCPGVRPRSAARLLGREGGDGVVDVEAGDLEQVDDDRAQLREHRLDREARGAGQLARSPRRRRAARPDRSRATRSPPGPGR